MKDLLIQNIPDEVVSFLSERAAREGRSMNAVTVSILTRAAGLEPEHCKRRDLSWLAGSWTKEESRRFDNAVSDCRKAREEDLRHKTNLGE
ncbi:MAG: hypothetical protein IJK04_10590 [Kiritimatiellae bacterium]|nr:hypothetical protein [Kiritimatiellia bacterium]